MKERDPHHGITNPVTKKSEKTTHTCGRAAYSWLLIGGAFLGCGKKILLASEKFHRSVLFIVVGPVRSTTDMPRFVG